MLSKLKISKLNFNYFVQKISIGDYIAVDNELYLHVQEYLAQTLDWLCGAHTASIGGTVRLLYKSTRPGFPNLFDPRPPCPDTEDSATQALIFTMIMMIILRFALYLMVFYDDFPFPIENKFIFIPTFASATPFLRPRDPQVGKP